MTWRDEVRAELGPVVERCGGGPTGWQDQLVAFLELLRNRNEVVNLVSRRTPDDWVRRHLLPSLAVLPLVPTRTIVRVLDVGSGGGLPGIPLKILRPDARVDLVEATRKKVDFLSECRSALELTGLEAHWCRVEAPSESLRSRGPFDLAVARAVGHEEALIRAVPALLAADGRGFWIYVAPSEPLGEPPAEIIWRDRNDQPVTALRRVAG